MSQRKRVRANGEGSCYQLTDGRWRAVSADRRVYRTRRTQRDAIAARDDAQAKLGRRRATSDSSVAEYAAIWRRHKEPTIRVTTAALYSTRIDLYVLPQIGMLPLRRVTPADIQKSIDSVQDRTAYTTRQVYNLLRQIFESATAEGLIDSNPAIAASVRVPKKPDVKAQPLHEDAIRRFLHVAHSDRLEALWLLLLQTGMRRGEALGLDLEDVRLSADGGAGGQVTVRRALHWFRKPGDEHGGFIFLPPKTKRGYRTLDIAPIVAEALQRWFKRREEERVAMGERWTESGVAFCARRGGPLQPAEVTRRFHKLLIKADVRRVKLHILRHTAASIMLRDGADIKTVQQILGHANAMTTLDTYSHVMPGTSAAATAKMHTVLTRLGSGGGTIPLALGSHHE